MKKKMSFADWILWGVVFIAAVVLGLRILGVI